MHELSICYGLLSRVERVARQNEARTVSRIVLQIGPLSGVEPELLRRAWPMAATGTIAGDAILDIEAAELRVRCTECGEESVVPSNKLLCGSCGDYRTRIVSGEDLILRTLEMETARVPCDTDAGQAHRGIQSSL